MTDQPIGKYTTTLDMLMHHHPWLAEMLQWKPIEKAPKDGTEILVYVPEKGIYHVKWRGALTPEGNLGWIILRSHHQVLLEFPTHYLPLPAIPDSKGWKNFEGSTP